jgi:hypothetical protein
MVTVWLVAHLAGVAAVDAKSPSTRLVFQGTVTSIRVSADDSPSRARLEEGKSEFAFTKTAQYRRFMALVHAAETGDVRLARRLI